MLLSPRLNPTITQALAGHTFCANMVAMSAYHTEYRTKSQDFHNIGRIALAVIPSPLQQLVLRFTHGWQKRLSLTQALVALRSRGKSTLTSPSADLLQTFGPGKVSEGVH